MKQFTVEITDEALADMEGLYNYIAFALHSPENAIEQYNRIADEILKLDIFPERFRIIASELGRSKEIRRMLVDNYSVLLWCERITKIIKKHRNTADNNF